MRGSFTDNHRSASRRASKEREQFELLIEQIRAGKGDVLVVWEISHKERDLAVYVRIRDMCHEVGLYFWLVGGVPGTRHRDPQGGRRRRHGQ